MVGREPWSSGYMRRLASGGREFEPQHRILDGHFKHYIVVRKLECLFEKTENK